MAKLNLVSVQRPLFLFVHVPKCAGTTVLRSLARVGRRQCIILSNSGKTKAESLSFLNRRLDRRNLSIEKIQAIIGHDVFLGLHELTTRPAFYLTFLRNPVDRYISHYRYFIDCSKNRRSRIHQHARETVIENGKQLTIEQCLERKHFANYMIKHLSAAADPDRRTGFWCKAREGRYRELAGAFLGQMKFIGLVESFSDDLKSICQMVGVQPVKRIVNRSRTRIPIEIDDELRAKIADGNRGDVWLYKQAVQLKKELSRGRENGGDVANLGASGE